MMDEARKRKQKIRDTPPKSTERKHTPPAHKRKPWMIVASIGVTILAIFVLGQLLLASHDEDFLLLQRAISLWSNVTSSLFDGKDEVYAVMLDAGSTGTRVLVFTFERSKYDNRLKLVNEFFKEVKPGISSYVNEPEKAAKSVRGLLDDAKSYIPPVDWPHTPAALKATAGLRLLPQEQADVLLDHVRNEFARSGFMQISNAVSIMDGSSEGLFSWFTLNLLLARLSDSKENTVASLDLGGGSTQVSLLPILESTFRKANANDIINVTVANEDAQVYVHSYSGLGIMEARRWILEFSNREENAPNNTFHTACFAVGSTETWSFKGVEYTILGPRVPLQRTPSIIEGEEVPYPESFYHCLRYTSFLIHDKVDKIPELQSREVYAMSYYFDRAVERGLIDASTGGVLKVGDYCTAASQACDEAKPTQPFACLDLTFICALLERGYGLERTKRLNIKKKIDGHETSWALGAAYQMLTALP